MFDDMFDEQKPDNSEQVQCNLASENWSSTSDIWSTKSEVWNNEDNPKLWDA